MDTAEVVLVVLVTFVMLLAIPTFALVIWVIVRLKKLESRDNFAQGSTLAPPAQVEEPQQPVDEQPDKIQSELTTQFTMNEDSKIITTSKPKAAEIGSEPKTTATVQKSQKEKVVAKQKSPASNTKKPNEKPKIESDKNYMFPTISQVQKDSTSDADISLKNFVEKQQGIFKQYEIGKARSKENVPKENTCKLTPEQSINKTVKIATHEATTKPMSQMNAEKENESSSGTPEHINKGNQNDCNPISIDKDKKKRRKDTTIRRIKGHKKKKNKNKSPQGKSKSTSKSKEKSNSLG